jgi:hypothetical protein
MRWLSHDKLGDVPFALRSSRRWYRRSVAILKNFLKRIYSIAMGSWLGCKQDRRCRGRCDVGSACLAKQRAGGLFAKARLPIALSGWWNGCQGFDRNIVA